MAGGRRTAAALPPTDVSPDDANVHPEPARKGIRWKALIGLLGLAGLAVGVFTTVDDAREVLPAPGQVAAATVLQFVAMIFVARAWTALFPPTEDKATLTRGLYTSQLTKYLPAGGFVQAASQVALSSQGGVVPAALRLPVFSACAVAAAATVGSGLAFDADLPGWARLAAALGLVTVLLLDRRVLQRALAVARRVVHRLPDPGMLPPQRAIIRCYAALLVNELAYGAAFAVLLSDVADVNPMTAVAAFCAGWALGYLALPLPSGLGVREAVLVAALPGLNGSILAASLVHRLLGLVAEAVLAGTSHLRAAARKRA